MVHAYNNYVSCALLGSLEQIQSKLGTPSVLQDRDGQIEILRVYALQFVWYCNIMITVFQYLRFSVIFVVMALNISASW